MPAPANNAVAVRRDGDALVFTGALSRDVVPALWHALPANMAGVRRLDIRAVERLDSSGLALLSTLSTRAEDGVTVVGNPPGLDALRAAYRLDDTLGFTTT
ncbi:STAS domain-containing protein [Thermomonas sp.]|uniref:STAS domain-containing protein n=1 Tax=Thermomonas sp. TaxID=1971895 RepID=UPI002489AA86|nr:STAS domain-containing protein [Thermomonas sp.]MDI1252396.1 STAS domain-containing protein [Thermomonas sp.]